MSITRFLTARPFQIVLLLMLLFVSVLVLRNEPRIVQRMRHISFDFYNKIYPRPAGNDTVIIDIDEESLRRLGQWPWPRNVVGDIPVILKELGAKSVAFDMVFAEPDRTSPNLIADRLPQTPELAPVAAALRKLPDNDTVFAQKIAQAGNVVTGFVASNMDTGRDPMRKAGMFEHGQDPNAGRFVHATRHFATPLESLETAAAGSGSFGMLPEADGILRRVPLLFGEVGSDGKVSMMYPALSVEALRVALGLANYKIESNSARGWLQDYGIQSVSLGKYQIPTDEYGDFWVYYTGHRPGIYVPAWKILAHQVDPALIKDKIAFVGTSAIGLLDLRSSPLDLVLPGVEIHTEIVEQILHKQFLWRNETLTNAEVFVTMLVCLFIIFVSPFVGAGWLAAIIVSFMLAGFFGGLYYYRTEGLLLDALCPSFVIMVVFVLSSVLTNLRTEMEKRMIRQAFDRYLSPALIEELVKDPSRLKLGGDVRELSVMFTDIRNFTTISESMDPAELIRMMNDFLTPMTSAVLDNKGFVDKYMGDAMMTFWNAPVDDSFHAKNACRAAMEMVEALKPVNVELRARAEAAGRVFHELKAGIGINSGRASVGNMGSKQRFAYSALGDTVNLASRMEGQTKTYGITCMIAHSTRMQVQEFATIELDLLTVKGRAEPERVYALLGDERVAKTPEFDKFQGLHARMLAAYRSQKWDEASSLMMECERQRPDLAALYRLYAERIAVYKSNPPGPDWTGVWVAKEK